MLVGGIRPHLFCLPILKRSRHQQALIDAAVSGDQKFFLGTDSAPHARDTGKPPVAVLGVTATMQRWLYAEVFDQAGALDRFEAFASKNGADFYGVDYNTNTVTLRREPWSLPDQVAFAGTQMVPLAAAKS